MFGILFLIEKNSKENQRNLHGCVKHFAHQGAEFRMQIINFAQSCCLQNPIRLQVSDGCGLLKKTAVMLSSVTVCVS